MKQVEPRAFVSGPRERDWLIPASVMTAGLGLAALLLMRQAGYDQIPDYFSRFLNWLNFMFIGVVIVAAVQLARLKKAGISSPIAHLKLVLLEKSTFLLAAVAGAMLGGIDMLFFMWIKPEITAVSPFWADNMLANADHALFGTDPWRLFQGIDLTAHASAYSFLWAVAVMGTTVWLLAQKPSTTRSASLIAYFALWSLFGTIGQYFFSSAGPIFYQRIGLGDRFAELGESIPQVTQMVSGYLWNLHGAHRLGVGAGISAMPSLHIATVAWIALAFHGQRSKLTPLAILLALYMWAMSVALGWHYAVDGIVGAGGAIACWALSSAWLKRRRVEVQVPELAAAVR